MKRFMAYTPVQERLQFMLQGTPREVYGFESVESSIYDAKENLEINKVENVSFIQADLYKSFLPFTNVLPKPDVVILDPPRGGMHTTTVNDVLELSPKKIVYVSCNPSTQVRDIKLFAEGKPVTGYSTPLAFSGA